MKQECKSMTLFDAWLTANGRSAGTSANYCRNVTALFIWLGNRDLTTETANAWKAELLETHAPVTVNAMLAALNSYARFAGLDIRTQFVKIQRRLFRDSRRELTRAEFENLLDAAQHCGKERLSLLMETICASGIRVSEVKFITVEAAKAGRATISLKGKVREILLPGQLCRKLLKYAGKQKIASGEIFLTGSGKSLSRGQIWAEMKRLCKQAGVAESKVFPHNLRHLFATAFYKINHDIVHLADILGHIEACVLKLKEGNK